MMAEEKQNGGYSFHATKIIKTLNLYCPSKIGLKIRRTVTEYRLTYFARINKDCCGF